MLVHCPACRQPKKPVKKVMKGIVTVYSPVHDWFCVNPDCHSGVNLRKMKSWRVVEV